DKNNIKKQRNYALMLKMALQRGVKDPIRMKSKHYFISIFVKALLFSNFLDIMPLYGGKINEKIIK
ncbi:hypothetical protein CGK76_02495, partial [Erysipelotrichaceae bacterium 7770_A6]|nr:hypothetical protein [Erysipelotrichaceae bacterium 7770_A6]